MYDSPSFRGPPGDSILRELEPHRTVTFGIVAPILAYLHKRNRCTPAHRGLDLLRASVAIALMVCPPLPSTILRWLSRST